MYLYLAYDLNKHVERHAYNTYDEFLKTHGEELKLQPAPQVAIDYYRDGKYIYVYAHTHVSI
jgi:ubiquinol oxidase